MEDDSILKMIRRVVGGMEEDCTDFDVDLIVHINTCLSILTQLGVGPKEGFEITGDKETWSEFLKDTKRNGVKTYVILQTRLLFDPPQSSVVTQCLESQIKELTWRLQVASEDVEEVTQ